MGFLGHVAAGYILGGLSWEKSKVNPHLQQRAMLGSALKWKNLQKTEEALAFRCQDKYRMLCETATWNMARQAGFGFWHGAPPHRSPPKWGYRLRGLEPRPAAGLPKWRPTAAERQPPSSKTGWWISHDLSDHFAMGFCIIKNAWVAVTTIFVKHLGDASHLYCQKCRDWP